MEVIHSPSDSEHLLATLRNVKLDTLPSEVNDMLKRVARPCLLALGTHRTFDVTRQKALPFHRRFLSLICSSHQNERHSIEQNHIFRQ